MPVITGELNKQADEGTLRQYTGKMGLLISQVTGHEESQYRPCMRDFLASMECYNEHIDQSFSRNMNGQTAGYYDICLSYLTNSMGLRLSVLMRYNADTSYIM